MFENMTYEAIITDMLSRVSSDVDKREGSVIYDALAPCAYQLAQVYFNLNNYIDLFFIDTAVGEYLDRKTADLGITRKEATYAVRQIETTGPVDIGTRWGLENTSYMITSLISENVYAAVCEQPGEIGNTYTGIMDNIDNISGIAATLTNIITRGTDDESDNNLRERVKQHLINPAQDGNVNQYKQWAMEYEGIGAAKVFPLWNGGNTVKIAITNGSFLPAEAALVGEFQEYIDPGAEGLGNGVAPIGSKVTVTGGTRKNIDIAGSVILSEGYTEIEGVANAISAYLASITYVKNSVSYMRIGSALVDCPSIAEISGLTLNSGIADVPLTGDEIPVLNSLSLTVVVP